MQIYLRRDDGILFNNDFYIVLKRGSNKLTYCNGVLGVMDAKGKVVRETFYRTDWEPGEEVHIQIPVSAIEQPIQRCKVSLECQEGGEKDFSWSW